MSTPTASPSAASQAFDALQVQILQNKGNLSALGTIRAPNFVASPEFRGTMSIIYSCIVTLIACIYTALHLNVPTKSGLRHTLAYKGKWVFIGLIAPEIVLYLAISQFLEARDLIKELNALLDEKEGLKPRDLEAGGENDKAAGNREPDRKNLKPSPNASTQPVDDGGEHSDVDRIIPARFTPLKAPAADEQNMSKIVLSGEEAKKNDYRFDLKYGFFVVMGGMEVPVHDIETVKPGATRGSQFSGRLRLSSKGVLQLAKHDYFLAIPRSTIDDKSKADVIQKVLVMTQVTWMAMQCIARKVYGLPLTLLEVHTMVHVVCAVALFGLWIHKPKDIQDPELLNISEFNDIVALMYQESLIGSDECNPDNRPHYNTTKKLYARNSDGIDDETFLNSADIGATIFLSAGQRFRFGLGVGPHQKEFEPIPFRKVDIVRWKRIISAIERISGTTRKVERSDEPYFPDGKVLRYPDANYHKAFTTRPGNIQHTGGTTFLDSNSSTFFKRMLDPRELLTFIFESKLLLSLLLTLPAAYGGIHLAAINFDFPSPVESLVWKLAATYTIIAMPLVFPLEYLSIVLYLKFRHPIDKIAEAFCKYLSLAVLFGYILARTYLVVESFISLRAEPIGVFWTPAWLQMIPHI